MNTFSSDAEYKAYTKCKVTYEWEAIEPKFCTGHKVPKRLAGQVPIKLN